MSDDLLLFQRRTLAISPNNNLENRSRLVKAQVIKRSGIVS
jgi:hypothetical protein